MPKKKTDDYLEKCEKYGYDPNNIISKEVLQKTYTCPKAERDVKSSVRVITSHKKSDAD